MEQGPIPPHAPRILLLDDDVVFRRVLKGFLEDAGYAVTELHDGRDVTHICCDLNIDLVLTDLLMPEREGLETIEDLKRNKPELPVIAFSGAAQDEPDSRLEHAKRLGAACTLEKPFHPSRLLEIIRSLL
jgi:CheY-like chemotaxis protein